MARDEDDTDRYRGPRRGQTANDRDLAARRLRTSAVGIPVATTSPAEPEDETDTTRPHDLFKPDRLKRHRQPGDSVLELAQQLRERNADPHELIATMAYEFTDAKRATRSESKELDRQFKAFLAIQPGGERFDELERKVAALEPVQGGLKWLQRSVVVIVVAIGTWLYARGGKETAIDMRIQALEVSVGKFDSTVGKLTDLVQRLLERRERQEPRP